MYGKSHLPVISVSVVSDRILRAINVLVLASNRDEDTRHSHVSMNQRSNNVGSTMYTYTSVAYLSAANRTSCAPANCITLIVDSSVVIMLSHSVIFYRGCDVVTPQHQIDSAHL